METTKIKSFKDLFVWQKGHILVLKVYKLSINFPKDEIFALVSQIRRAVVSITSNIAEGFGRQSSKEKVQFYCIAYGSLLETLNQLEIAKDLTYINKKDFEMLEIQLSEMARMLQSLMKVIKASY